ncbi:hypothetical protein EDB19DRAFT_612502 [Suillus lakei]|nr:hypothetical protein EDB19DRAFT_612502 [Suillus lakei]
MANASTAGATAPKTPPHGVNSEPELNSAALAVGPAAIWPEEEGEREAEILQNVYEIAKNDEEGGMKRHVPMMVWFHEFEDTSTAKIRSALANDGAESGKRVLYINVSRKLLPMMKLSGKEFLSAWWQSVLCRLFFLALLLYLLTATLGHQALWKEGVHHCQVSPSNLMVYQTSSDGRWIGVLNDFDLSSTPSGQERTWTVPFMANELLTKEAIEGEVKHRYQHDAESFIWVLTWVCLRYQNGRLLRKGRPLDEWLKVDVNGCREKKTDFLFNVAQSCLLLVNEFYAKPKTGHPKADDSEADDSEVDDSEAEDSEADDFGAVDFEADDFEADDSAADDSEADDSKADNHVSDYLTDAIVFKTWLKENIPRRRRSQKPPVVTV